MEPAIVSGIAEIELEEIPEAPASPNPSTATPEDSQFYNEILLPKELKKELIEILRCAVCLELPKLTSNTQVHICENGHHFCKSCHGRLTTCAVCRGNLGRGRNFVVEELIMKLGKRIGIVKPPCYMALPPPALPKGTYACPHVDCNVRSPALRMLTHFRDAHKPHLLDNLRSNPHSGWFEAAFEVPLAFETKYVKSYQVSDMGLLTVVINIPKVEDNVVQISGYIQMIQMTYGFLYNLSVTNGSRQCVALDRNLSSFIHPAKLASVFDVKEPKEGDQLIVNCMVRRKESLKPVPLTWPTSVNEVLSYNTDRPSRRTITRNERRRKLRKRFRDASSTVLIDGLTSEPSGSKRILTL